MNIFLKLLEILLGYIFVFHLDAVIGVYIQECALQRDMYSLEELMLLLNATIPSLDKNKRKGEFGKIGVIGGSIEYTGATYFAAITSLKVGADEVLVISTESAAPVIKSYSPELIVYPFLSGRHISKVPRLLKEMDVIIIGPGLGRENFVKEMITEIINVCRNLKKPLVIDDDGLHIISNNLQLITNYPLPGVILLPNIFEMRILKEKMEQAGMGGFGDLGLYTSYLLKGKYDYFVSRAPQVQWALVDGGSGRRAGGQGNILAGALGTLFNWAIKSDICEGNITMNMAASIASLGAARITRSCNEKAFESYGRSMTALDMLGEIHIVLSELLGQ